jgi:hypothetical protein
MRSDLLRLDKKTEQGPVKAWRQQMQQMKKTLDDVKRRAGRSQPLARPAAQQRALPNIVAVVRGSKDFLGDADTRPAGSSSEVKSGHQSCMLAPVEQHRDLCKNISKLKECKSMWKDLRKHFDSNSDSVEAIRNLPTQRKLKKMLEDGFDAASFHLSLPLPKDSEWWWKVYEPVWWGLSADASSISFTSFCCIEARLLLEGSIHMLGFPPEQLPGSSVKEKREMLSSTTIDDLAKLVKTTNGFYALVETNDLIVVPSAWLVITIGNGGEGSMGVRWCMSADSADDLRVLGAVQGLLASFPELKNPSQGYIQFLKWTTTTVCD